jgi:hypothetical protein
VLLAYLESFIAGSRSQPEQWDLYRCTCCSASFEYRHYTQRLRKTDTPPRRVQSVVDDDD